MIPYPVYKTLHFIGLFMLFIGLGGGAALLAFVEPMPQKARKWIGMFHGVGLLFALVGGFGMMARLGIHWPFPGWISAKLAIWILLGASIAMIKRRAAPSGAFSLGLILLGGLAAYLAVWKPF